MRKMKEVGLVLLGIGMAIAVNFDWRGGERDPLLSRMGVLSEVLGHVNDKYVDEVKPELLFEGMMRGMVQALDPYCDYLAPEHAKQYLEFLHGNFGGLGIVVELQDGYVTVISPLEGTPAFEAGLMPGDRIVAADGVPLVGMNLDQAVHCMRGKPGTTIRLEVLRPGEANPTPISITRGVIKRKSVYDATILDPVNDIGYVRITRFHDGTAEEFATAVKELMEKRGMKSLVLDLRNNPGGLLNGALRVADEFLESGAIMIEQRRGRPLNIERASPGGLLVKMPVTVLVNGATASAAEVLAGALQDARVAALVGERTYGKGCVQTVLNLTAEPAILKLTTSLYYTPDGHAVQKGVKCLHKGWCFHRRSDAEVARGGLRPNEEVRISQMETLLLRSVRHRFLREGVDPLLLLQTDRQLRAAVNLLRNRALFKHALSRTVQNF